VIDLIPERLVLILRALSGAFDHPMSVPVAYQMQQPSISIPKRVVLDEEPTVWPSFRRTRHSM